jgi:hypothetical protein
MRQTPPTTLQNRVDKQWVAKNRAHQPQTIAINHHPRRTAQRKRLTNPNHHRITIIPQSGPPPKIVPTNPTNQLPNQTIHTIDRSHHLHIITQSLKTNSQRKRRYIIWTQRTNHRKIKLLQLNWRGTATTEEKTVVGWGTARKRPNDNQKRYNEQWLRHFKTTHPHHPPPHPPQTHPNSLPSHRTTL